MKHQLLLAAPRKKNVLVLVVALCLLASWFFLYYIRTQERITQHRTAIQNLITQEQTITKAADGQATLKREIQTSKHALNIALNDTQRNRQGTNNQIINIAQQAQKFGLTLTSCTTQNKKKKDWFTKQNVTYKLSGEPQKIKRFVHKLGTTPHALKCKSLSLTTEQNQTSELTCEAQLFSFG